MSCDSNSNKVGKGAGLKAGLSALGGKFSHALGSMVDRSLLTGYRVGMKAAKVSDAVLNTIDRRGIPAQVVREKAVKAAVAGATVKALGRQGIPEGTAEQTPMAAFAALGSSKALPLALAVTATRQTSAALASLASHAGREEQMGLITQDRSVDLLGIPLGTAREQVSVWRTKLTPALNALDLPNPFQREGVRASDGVLFQTGGVTWHRGTMIVDTPRGERMICHLQNLALPPTHYYFSAHLSNDQAVGIAAGRVRPEQQPGYVGQVSQIESLTVGWAAAKHAMIRSCLYWGDPTPPPPIQAEEENRKEYQAYGVEQ